MKHVIINAITQTFGFDGNEIFHKCRKRHLVESRQISIYYLRKYKGWSLYQIGDLFSLGYAATRHAYFEYQYKLDLYKSEYFSLQKFIQNIERKTNYDKLLLKEFISNNDKYLSTELKEYLIKKL